MTRRSIGELDGEDALEAARDALGELAGANAYGAFAVGLHRRVRKGVVTGAPALNVYVAHKRVAPPRRVPETLVTPRGLVLRADVIGVGSPPRAHDAPDDAPPLCGLYAGAAIRAEGRVHEYGGVACLLGDDGIATHLLTSGHLFAAREGAVAVVGGEMGRPPAVVGHLAVNLLDAPYGGASHAVDVALVALTEEGASMAARSHDGPRVTDMIAGDAVSAVDVAAFLPTAHDYSRPTTTLDGPLDVRMQSPLRGAYLLRGAGATLAAITSPGDSGTLLYNGPPEDAAAVGICVGQLGAMCVFEPFARALAALRKVTGMALHLVRENP